MKRNVSRIYSVLRSVSTLHCIIQQRTCTANFAVRLMKWCNGGIDCNSIFFLIVPFTITSLLVIWKILSPSMETYLFLKVWVIALGKLIEANWATSWDQGLSFCCCSYSKVLGVKVYDIFIHIQDCLPTKVIQYLSWLN